MLRAARERVSSSSTTCAPRLGTRGARLAGKCNTWLTMSMISPLLFRRGVTLDIVTLPEDDSEALSPSTTTTFSALSRCGTIRIAGQELGIAIIFCSRNPASMRPHFWPVYRRAAQVPGSVLKNKRPPIVPTTKIETNRYHGDGRQYRQPGPC